MTRNCSNRWRGLTFRMMTLAVGLASAAAGLQGCAHPQKQPPPPSVVPATKPELEHAAETGIPVASTPQGLLKEGAEKSIQKRLVVKGLLTSDECSGQLDAATRTALRAFQKGEGLPTTGLPSYETVSHLGLDLDDVFHTTRRPRDPTEPASSKTPGPKSPG